MVLTKKQIAFDLDTKALEKYYPKKNWRKAYEIIKKHMTKYKFEWQQGSVYTSKQPMKYTVAKNALSDLVKKNPWMNVCMRDCTTTNIGEEYSNNDLFDKSAPIPARVE